MRYLIFFLVLLSFVGYSQEEKNTFDYWVDEFNLGVDFFEKEDYSNNTKAAHFSGVSLYLVDIFL